MTRSFMFRPRIRAAAAAAANMMAAIVILAVPAYFEVPVAQVLALSVALVSLQAGQAAAVQTRAMIRVNSTYMAVLAAPLLLLGAAMTTKATPPDIATVGIIIIGIAGLAIGIYIGGSAVVFLDRGQPVEYQVFILQRNLLWVGVVALFSVTMPGYLSYSIPISWIIFIIIKRASLASRGSTLSLALGAVTGLVYRNDVNIARGMAAGTNFSQWHYFFIVYTAVQALIGFVVINEIFSRRERIARECTRIRIVILTTAIIASAALSAVGVATIRNDSFIPALGALVLVLGIVVSVQAAVAHVLGASNWVYIGGILGFGLLVVLAALGVSPGIGIVAELAVSASIVALAVLFTSLHRRSGDRALEYTSAAVKDFR